jgi:serine/threonine-protein kinase RsbW
MELQVRAQRSAVRVARHWVVDQARREGVPDAVVPLIELLTSEVVANAVIHAPDDAPVTVRTTRLDGSFTVAVTDRSPEYPQVQDSGPDVPGGHGVRLIATLSQDWGVDPDGSSGKTVWFRVSL